MPDALLPDEGIGQQLECILQRTVSGVLPWNLMLWVNDIVPDTDIVLADLVEATFGGYSQVTLTRSDWTTPDVHDGCAHSTWMITPTVWNVTSGPTENALRVRIHRRDGGSDSVHPTV